MKNIWFSYIGTILLGSILCVLVFWILGPVFTKNAQTLSPLPNFLTIFNNTQVTTLSIWTPNVSSIQHAESRFTDLDKLLSSQSAIVYDLSTRQALYAKNTRQKLPMASLTKIMTAIIALENKRSDDSYVVIQNDLVGENSMGLTAGEKLTLEELLYGLLLLSGNDAAEVLARNTLGREQFVVAMNKKANALSLTSTHFTNPTGLQGDGDQYTSATDLLVITQYALSHFPLFGKVVATFQQTIPYSDKHKEFYLENETNLISTYPGVKGVKDGYTPEAGLCLVTYLEYSGHKIIGVILGSNNRRDEMKELLDYSLKSQGIKPPPHG